MAMNKRFKVWVTRVMPNKTVSEKAFQFDTESEAYMFFNLKVVELRCKIISRKDYSWSEDDTEIINVRSRGKNSSVDLLNDSFKNMEEYYQ